MLAWDGNWLLYDLKESRLLFMVRKRLVGDDPSAELLAELYITFENGKRRGRELGREDDRDALASELRKLFPAKLPEFFIRFLTEPGDTVLDIFAGSNTTGEVAEAEGRNWLAFEERPDYVAASSFRILDRLSEKADVARLYAEIVDGKTVDLRERDVQRRLLP